MDDKKEPKEEATAHPAPAGEGSVATASSSSGQLAGAASAPDGQPLAAVDSAMPAAVEGVAETAPRSEFPSLISGFIDHIDGLADTFPLATLIVASAHALAVDKYNTFLDTHGTPMVNDGKKVFTMPPDQLSALRRLDNRYNRMDFATTAIPRSMVVALISEFDAYLSGLIRLMFLAHPEMLNASERTLTLANLMEFGSIDAAREYIIEKEIETVLRKSHIEQFDWLERKLSITLRKDLEIWPDFIELTERRNLYVHNNGVVTRQYLDNCKQAKADCSGTSHGGTLSISDEYFRRAHGIVFELGVKLGHVLWRKVLPKERPFADAHLSSSVVYELIFHGRYRLATKIADFSTEGLKKFESEYHRRVLIINRAQAYKWSGDEQKCQEILRNEDWSASKDEFQMAVAALKGDFGGAINLMRQLGASDTPGKMGYREWPVFRDLRKDVNFQSAFQEIFNEPLSIAPPVSKKEDGAAVPENDPKASEGDDEPTVH